MHNINIIFKCTARIFKCTTLSGNKSGAPLTGIKCIHAIVQPILTYIFRTFLSSQTETPYPLNNKYSLQCLATTILLLISLNLPILGTSYKWNHTIFVVSCLSYFTQYSIFKVHPYCMNVLEFNSFLRLNDTTHTYYITH